jgi:hypothetical protein
MICELESNYYRESVHGDPSHSLSLFVRTVSKFELHWVFDPEFTLPASPSPCATSFTHTQGVQMPTWGLSSSVTMMDAGVDTTSCIWACSPSCGDENLSSAYELYSLDDESATAQAILPNQYSTETSEIWTPSPNHLWSTEYNGFLQVSTEIISRLKKEVCCKRSGQAMYPHEWNFQTANECYALFGPDSLTKFTEEYWSTWYIHWPAIHRATFQISQASAALIASMVLLSTSYSPDTNTRNLGRCWSDAVELMVFTDEYFGSATLYSAVNKACLERRLRALQAGLAICVYQTFEGSAMSKRRARRTRFNEVVDVSCLS